MKERTYSGLGVLLVLALNVFLLALSSGAPLLSINMAQAFGQSIVTTDEQMYMTNSTGGLPSLYTEHLIYSTSLDTTLNKSMHVFPCNDLLMEGVESISGHTANFTATYPTYYDDFTFNKEVSCFSVVESASLSPQYARDCDSEVNNSNDTTHAFPLIPTGEPTEQLIKQSNSKPTTGDSNHKKWLIDYIQPIEPLTATNPYVESLELPAFDPNAPSDPTLRHCGSRCDIQCNFSYHEGGHRESHRNRILFVDNAHLIQHWPPRPGAYLRIPSPIQAFLDAVLEMRPRDCSIGDPCRLVEYYRSGMMLPGRVQGDKPPGYGEVREVKDLKGKKKAKTKRKTACNRGIDRVSKARVKAATFTQAAAAAADEHAKLVWRVWEGTGQ